MTTVLDIFRFLDDFAPVSLAESWDNVGILCGDPEAPVKAALVALDITPDVVGQARAAGAQLVVSHHPVIFKPVPSVTANGPGAAAYRLAGAGIAAVCMHTNLDVCRGGVADILAGRLGLGAGTVLHPLGRERYRKIVVFVPKSHAESVREALAAAGAGRLGAYDSCCFLSGGTGCFRPLPGAHPFLGEPGKLERAEEIRLEAICPAKLVPGAVRAMCAAHPYEVPAYDVFDDEAVGEPYGVGRLCTLRAEETAAGFSARVKAALSCAAVKLADAGRPVRRVAVCNGSLDEELLEDAVSAGADTVLTGEAKHSLFLEAAARGLNLAAAGHFATENVVCPALLARLTARFPGVRFAPAAQAEPYAVI